MRKIAFIDFDGTARRGDSVVDFIKYLHKKKKITLRDLLYSAWQGILYKLNIRSEKYAKEHSLRFITRLRSDAIDELGRSFVRDIVKNGIFNEMHDLIDELHDDGYIVVIVSASPNIYMQFVGDIMLVDDIICTRFIKKADKYTGRIYGQNCKGEQKIFMIKSFIQEKHPDCELSECAAYGDSKSDLPMMSIVGKKCFVNNYKLYNKFVDTKEYNLKYWLN